jgi:glycosyltransferase involved in cell wall biosynthesis
MVERLAHEVSFSIITKHQNGGDAGTCPGTEMNQWTQNGKSRVFSLSPWDLVLLRIRGLMQDINPAVVYLTSFFSPLTLSFLAWRKLKRIPRVSCVLAPCGEFSRGALEIKKLRKNAYISACSRLGLFDDVIWHASWAGEEGDIRATWPKPITVRVAPLLTPIPTMSQDLRTVEKSPFAARFVYLSRIAPVKNLLFAIELLKDLRGEVRFDIFGPVEDQTYWAACEQAIRLLPPNINVRYLGLVDHPRVHDVLADYHFFLLPTLGENFGYAIHEALTVGCPPIVSDRTPWQTLNERGIGWQIPLQDRDRWRGILQECVDMPEITYRQMAEAARAFVVDRSLSSSDVRQNIDLFQDAVAMHGDSAGPLPAI